jgi:hypothetical protein
MDQQRKQDQNVPRQSSLEPVKESEEKVQNKSSVERGDRRPDRDNETGSGDTVSRGRNTERSQQEQISKRDRSQSER